MPHDAAARILRRLDDALRAPLLEGIRPAVATALRRALAYPPDTAAGLMDARGLSLPAHLTVADALARFRRSDGAVGSYLYVVGPNEVLEGVLGLRQLLAARRQSHLRDIMAGDVARIPALVDHASVLDHPGWRRFHELPVIDAHGRLLGIIRYSTARRLERDGTAIRAASGTLAPWVHIGELYLVGMAKVVGSLVSALGAVRRDRP
jgi:magnesium transporter